MMPKEIYLDNSATTRVSKAAAEKALYMMTQCYGLSLIHISEPTRH